MLGDEILRSTGPSFRRLTEIPPRSKDGPSGPLWALEDLVSVPATGRCEPRGRTWPYSPVVSNLGKPAAPTPPSGGLFHISGVNAIFTGPELSWPRFGDACPSGLPPWLLRRGR